MFAVAGFVKEESMIVLFAEQESPRKSDFHKKEQEKLQNAPFKQKNTVCVIKL